MSKVNFFAQGLGLKPTSADPTSPADGQLQMSDGTVRGAGLWRYSSTSSAWVAVGAGGGGLDVFHTEDFESNKAADQTSGNTATPVAAGTGTLDGTLANEESVQFAGDRSLKYTMGSSSANDFFLQDADIAVELKQTSNDIGVSFYYTYNGDDDDVRFFVLDQDDTELTSSIEYIKAKSTPTRFTTSFYLPVSSTGLRYGFQVGTGNSAKVLIVDDFELSTNPFVYKNLATEKNDFSARIANPSGTASITSQGGVNASDQNAIASVNRSALGVVDITFTTGFFTVAPSVTASIYKATAHSNFASIYGVSTTGVTIISQTDAGGYLDFDFNITIGRQEADVKTPSEHVVTPATANITYVRAEGNDAGGITADVEDINFTEVIDPSGAWDGDSYTVQNNSSLVHISGVIQENGPVAGTISLYKNGSIYKTVLGARSTYLVANKEFLFQSYKGEFALDDVLSLRTNTGFTLTNSTSGHYITVTEHGNATFLAAIPVQKVAFLKDVKSAGTAGGTFASGSWITRALSEVSGESDIVTLSSNQFTLSQGEYIIEASAPIWSGQNHKCKLYNITTSADTSIGSSETADSAGSTAHTTHSKLYTKVTIGSATVFEIQHRVSATTGASGGGIASNFGVDEVYTQVKITKLR